MTWQTFLFTPIALAAFGYSGYRFYILFKLMLSHRAKSGRTDQLGSRFRTSIVNVLGQKAVLRKKTPGIMHTTLLWAFLLITIGTIEQFATTIYPPAHFEFIGKEPYWILMLVQDIATLGVLVAVAYFSYRRFIVRPEGLGRSLDGTLVLAFTGTLKIALFLMNGFLLLGQHPWYASAMPVSELVAAGLSVLHFSPEINASLATLFKWVHMLIVLVFACYIPHSKHRHILFSVANTFFKSLSHSKSMTPINFEDESVQQYGAAKINDLSWKDALDYYSCTECGRCQDMCPAYNTQKPLTPKMLIVDLRENLYRNRNQLMNGKLEEVSPVIDENITDDVIWSCTSCRACEIACPVFVEHTNKIYDIRRNLVMMESRFPGEVQTVFKNLETNGSPWAFSPEDRLKWTEGLSIKTMSEDPKIDILFWVGCAGAFDDRNRKVIRAFASLLKKAEIRFAILGSEERCTGDAARRIGNEYLFQTLAKANIETLNRYQVKKIVTACPHCFNTLKNEYKDFGGNYEVIHHSEFIAQLIQEGKIKPTKALDASVTFHDSCYLGRWNNIYDEPRSVLEALPSARMVEMSQNRAESMCCGAGGGRMWMEEKLGKRINVTRTEQALGTNAEIIASSCPFCITMIKDGLTTKEMSDKVRVMDLAELVDQSTP